MYIDKYIDNNSNTLYMTKRKLQPSECLACWDDLDSSNLVEYSQTGSGSGDDWNYSAFCKTCTLHMLNTKFNDYMNSAQTTDCKKELTRLLKAGPPIWLEDKHGFPLVEEGSHVSKLCYFDGITKTVISAKLANAVEGEEREKIWDNLRQLLPSLEEEGSNSENL